MDRLSAPLPYPSFKLPWGHVLDEICSLATSMLSLLGPDLSTKCLAQFVNISKADK